MYSSPPRVDVLFRRSGLKNIVSSSFCGEKRLEICAVPVIGLTSGACIVLFYQLYQRLIRRSHFSVYQGFKLYNSASSCCRCIFLTDIHWAVLLLSIYDFVASRTGGGGRGSFCGESEKRADVKRGNTWKENCACVCDVCARVCQSMCVCIRRRLTWMCGCALRNVQCTYR